MHNNYKPTMAEDYTDAILRALSQSDGPLFTAKAFPTASFINIKSSLDRLHSREMVVYKPIEREQWVLSKEAQGITLEGSHEAKVFEAVKKAVEGLKISDLPV